MKTPDVNKCGMECIRTNAERICVKPENGQCPRCEQLVEEALVRVRQLESTYSQVSKALCGKESASLDDLLKAADQLKYRVKKPVEHQATLYRCGTCPSCGNVVSEHEKWGESIVRIEAEYCKFCGQHLDWSGFSETPPVLTNKKTDQEDNQGGM